MLISLLTSKMRKFWKCKLSWGEKRLFVFVTFRDCGRLPDALHVWEWGSVVSLMPESWLFNYLSKWQ